MSKGSRLPAALRNVRGTERSDRLYPDMPPVQPMDIIQMPTYLSSSARAEEIYHQLCAHLEGMKVLSTQDDFALAMLASTLEEVEILTGQIEDEGRMYLTATQKGEKMYRSHPAVAQRADAMRRAQSMLGEFGLTPATRSRVQMKAKTEENPFKMLDA